MVSSVVHWFTGAIPCHDTTARRPQWLDLRAAPSAAAGALCFAAGAVEFAGDFLAQGEVEIPKIMGKT